MNKNFLRPFILLSILITAAPLPVFAGSFAEAQHSMQRRGPRAHTMLTDLAERKDTEREPLLAKKIHKNDSRGPKQQKMPRVVSQPKKFPPITDVRDYWPNDVRGIIADYVGEEKWEPIHILDHGGGIIQHDVYAAWFNQPDEKTITTRSNNGQSPTFLPVDIYMYTIWDVQSGEKIKSFFSNKKWHEPFISEEVKRETRLIDPSIRFCAQLNNNKQLMLTVAQWKYSENDSESIHGAKAVLWKKISLLQQYLRKKEIPTLTYVPGKKTAPRKMCEECYEFTTFVVCMPCMIPIVLHDVVSMCCRSRWESRHRLCVTLCYTIEPDEQVE